MAKKNKQKKAESGEPGPSVKDPGLYEALRREGLSKKKSARIANAAAKTARSEVGHKGGEAENYEDRAKEELVDRAREVGIKGRSKMSKSELIDALRNS